MPGTDKCHIDVTENRPKTQGAYVFRGEREERYISKIIYKLINDMRNNIAHTQKKCPVRGIVF